MITFFWIIRIFNFTLDKADLREVVELKEKAYSYAREYRTAPRHYDDARDNFRLLLEVLGDVSANVIAPRAAEADKEGAHFRDGEVFYAAATQEAVEALKQAELMGIMLPWEYGGMNLPETIYQMMIEIVSRAEGGLMTIFGLQEIASTISEYGNEEQEDQCFAPLCQRRSGRGNGPDRTGCRLRPGLGTDQSHL